MKPLVAAHPLGHSFHNIYGVCFLIVLKKSADCDRRLGWRDPWVTRGQRQDNAGALGSQTVPRMNRLDIVRYIHQISLLHYWFKHFLPPLLALTCQQKPHSGVLGPQTVHCSFVTTLDFVRHIYQISLISTRKHARTCITIGWNTLASIIGWIPTKSHACAFANRFSYE